MQLERLELHDASHSEAGGGLPGHRMLLHTLHQKQEWRYTAALLAWAVLAQVPRVVPAALLSEQRPAGAAVLAWAFPQQLPRAVPAAACTQNIIDWVIQSPAGSPECCMTLLSPQQTA